MLVSEKTARDVTYMNILTCDCNDRQNKSTRTVMAFAANKYESSLIDEFLKNSTTKYLRQILH